MFRKRLKALGAALALASLLVLNLHVLAHVLGHDDDDDRGQPTKAPCALCQAVLAQHSLEAAPSIEAPSVVWTFAVAQAEGPRGIQRTAIFNFSPRGPPALGSA